MTGALARRRIGPKGPFSTVEEAIESIARGEIVIVVDDPNRENEGDFVMAAERITPEAVNFMVTHGRGLLCMPLDPDRADRLGLRPMVPGRVGSTAFTLSIDLRDPPTTGISALDRARCIRRASMSDATADEFRAPGHVFPLRARPGGVLERPGHTEAAVDLARLAGLDPAGAICEIMNPDGTMARLPDLIKVAEQHDLLLITIADLIAYRRRRERLLRREAEAHIPTPEAHYRAVAYSTVDGLHHVALIAGEVAGQDGVPASVHAECLLGDVFSSFGCACAARFEGSMRAIAEAGRGVVVYLRRAEDRALEFSHEPNIALEELGTAAQVLKDLGIESVRLFANGEHEALALAEQGIEIVEVVPMPSVANVQELRSTGAALAHDLLGLDPYEMMA